MPFLPVVCIGVFASAISWRSVDPMLPVIASDLGVSLRDAVLLSSAFSFPLAIMQVVFGPVGDPRAQLVVVTLVLEGILVLSLIPFVAGMVMLHGATGSGAAAAGIVIACFAVGGVAFGFLVRRILAALGQWNMVRAGGVLAGAALLLTALPVRWGVIAGLFFFVGFAFYMFHNAMQIHVTELAPHARGAGVSVGAFFFMTGQGLGPVIWCVVAGYTGFGLLFAVAGALTIALGLVAASVLGKRLSPRAPDAPA